MSEAQKRIKKGLKKAGLAVEEKADSFLMRLAAHSYSAGIIVMVAAAALLLWWFK